MNRIDTGDHKLAFLLPIFPETKTVLFLDLELKGLRLRLEELGIDVRSASITGEAPERSGESGTFDIIVSGRMPSGRAEESLFIEKVGNLLSPSGYLVVLASNRFGQSRLRGRSSKLPSQDEEGTSLKVGVRACTLRGVLRTIHKMDFEEVRSYSPIPRFENPSMFVSLENPNSIKFLLAQFPDFFLTRSRLLRMLLSSMIRAGTYKYILDRYVVIAGERRKS
jgi:hypothetical protein